MNDEETLAVESGASDPEGPVAAPRQRILGMSVRFLMRAGLAFGISLLVLSAALWYVAQGLEGKVLGAIERHLETDVGVGSVEMTFWSSWPDVEVLLNEVEIEDALDRGTSFLSLNSLGVAFDWTSLLMGEMEVSRIHLQGGSVRLLHTRDGRDNWKFWKESEAAGSTPLILEKLDLTEVLLEGEWWSQGADDPLVWRADVVELLMEGRWKEGLPTSLRGHADLVNAELSAAGEKWMDGIDLEADLGWDDEVRDQGMWFVSLVGGQAGRNGRFVPFAAGISGVDGFSMNLEISDAAVNDLYGLTPDFLMEKAPEDIGLTGRMGLDVRVGRGTADQEWKGALDPDWSGEWAVRLHSEMAGVNGKGWDVRSLRGRATVCSLEQGWRCKVEESSGKTMGGEFRASGVWQLQSGLESWDGTGECLLRPHELLGMAETPIQMPEGWTMAEQGALRASGPFVFERRGKGDWVWKAGDLDVAFTECQWQVEGGILEVADAVGEVGPSSAALRLRGIRAPGLSGSLGIEVGWRERLWKVHADVQSVDVDALMGWVPEGGVGRSSDEAGNLDWSGKVGEGTWGALKFRDLDAMGSVDLSSGDGEIESLSALVFGGRASVKGEWDHRGLSLDGRMAEAEIPELLFQTGGLGQSTLLPRHAKGRMWAEGRLGFRFDTTPERSWTADLGLRMEGAELVDFELLQRIPETLKEEARYRILADAEDLSRRLRRVQFEPITTQVTLEEGVFTLEPTEVVSDAMDVGISGWQSLNGRLDYTLDFALRDLKSKDEEFGTTADDGLGHRFFLSIAGTLDEPLFGYDGTAHKEHRRRERRDAVGRLKALISGKSGMSESVQDTGKVVLAGDSLRSGDSTKTGRDKVPGSLDLDTDDDFKR